MPDREKVIKGWECHMEADTLECADCPYREGWRTCNYADTLYKDVYELLKEQEAEIAQLNRFINGFSRDAVPVVRCKDCKYYDYFNGCMSWHDVNSNNDNWYCADGERRTDDA